VIGEELDVVSFQELTPDWADMLRDSLLGLLPYRYQQVRIDPYGMAVYSKHPLQMADTMQCRGIPMLHIAVDKGDARFHLVSSYLTAQGNLRVPYDHIFFSENLECVQFNEMKGASQKYLGIRGTYQLKSEVLSQYKELAN